MADETQANDLPHPSTLDPHSLVDMRIPHDPSHLGGVELLPTSDPNYKYYKAPEAPPPPAPTEPEPPAE